MRRLWTFAGEAFDVMGSCLCGHEMRSAAQRQPLLQPMAVQWFVTPITIACNPFRSQRGTGLLLRQNSSHRARDAGCHGRGSVPRPRRTPVVWSDNVRDRDAVTLGKVCSTSPAAGTRACLRARRRIPIDSGSAAGQMLPSCAIPPVAFGATRGGAALGAGCEPSASGPLRVPKPGIDISVNLDQRIWETAAYIFTLVPAQSPNRELDKSII